ncbi:hypothetical protein [Pedobacter jamesrossensis]|uniref:hypothetical protein n=1 Tax=Pedobacter jamesrossensis TaxID=1908238 RepID=UPI00362297A1
MAINLFCPASLRKWRRRWGPTVEHVHHLEGITGKGITGKLGKENPALGNKSLMDQISAAIAMFLG